MSRITSSTAYEAEEVFILTSLKAYFDESSDGEKVFFLGGWLAENDEWEKFSDAWEAQLKSDRPIRYFNHNEAMGRKDEFADWSESDRDQKIRELAKVVSRYELFGLVGGVHLKNFSTIFSGAAPPRRVLRSIITFTEPYHWAFNCIVAGTLGHQVEEAKNEIGQVDFILDEGLSYLDDCIENYPKLIKILPPKARTIAGTVVPSNDRTTLALQAADMLTGQMQLNVKTGIQPEGLQIMRNTRKIGIINCLDRFPESVHKSLSLINLAWSVKTLDKIKQRNRDESK